MKSGTNIIFDLDGTLIDSAPSILGAFKQVLEQFSYTPIRPLNSDLIGPPLNQTLQLISGESDPDKLTVLIEAFKSSYDNNAYALSTLYVGVVEMLEGLFMSGKSLHIATNKRLIPTQKILQYLYWEKYFKSVYAIDKVMPPYSSKAKMIEVMIFDLGLNPKECIYIGDRIEDANAAFENAVPFVYVDWGYGPDISEIKNYCRVKTPNDLLTLICNK
jgi:phosphoglycolate phosphatase